MADTHRPDSNEMQTFKPPAMLTDPTQAAQLLLQESFDVAGKRLKPRAQGSLVKRACTSRQDRQQHLCMGHVLDFLRGEQA
jgi:hypothetical protein